MPATHAVEQATPKPTRATGRRGPVDRKLRRFRFKWLIWIALIAGLVVGGRQVVVMRRSVPVEVHVRAVARGSVRDYVTSVTTGRIAAKREVSLRAEIVGTVKTLHHRRGDKVEAGDPLVSYDPLELRDRVRAAETGVAVAQAQLAQSEASLHLANDNARRLRNLANSGSLPPAQAEDAEQQAIVATKGSGAARAAVQQAYANVELARVALSKAVVRAPFRGTVLTTSVEEGDVCTPGMPLFAFADLTELYADVEIDEADLGRVRVQMPADVMLDAFPDERFRGILREIAPSVTRDARGTRSVALRIDLPHDARLIVGMSADVDVIVTTRDDVLFVPPTAVLGRGGDRSVYVLTNGVAQKRTIDVGISTWEAVEVKNGLREGEQVIVSLNAPNLAEGARVVGIK